MNKIKRCGYRTTSYVRALLILASDVAGYGVLFPYWIWRRMVSKRPAADMVRRVALFRLDGVGDLVLSEPAIEAFRRRYRQARITLFVNKWAIDVAELIPWVDGGPGRSVLYCLQGQAGLGRSRQGQKADQTEDDGREI
jgi:hypothetical protein